MDQRLPAGPPNAPPDTIPQKNLDLTPLRLVIFQSPAKVVRRKRVNPV